MMMHHDDQPFYTPGSPSGLLNQVRLLRKAGAVSLQVLMITPAAGSRLYEETFTSGRVLRSAGGRVVDDHMFDGNYVIASRDRRPWRRQLNLLASYAYFYNPLRLLTTLLKARDRLGYKPAGAQLLGMRGLVQTARRTLGWMFRLMLGRIERRDAPPASRVPMRDPAGDPAAHAIPGTPIAPPPDAADGTPRPRAAGRAPTGATS